MPTITIYGCVNWGTGQIEFAERECLTISNGCIIWAGAHAGQVEITISDADNPDCNGTYYGCVNWTTGRFQVIIPEDCCNDVYSEYDCGFCDAGETPLYITVYPTGIVDCECIDTYFSRMVGVAASLNGNAYKLTQYTSPYYCSWVNYNLPGSYGSKYTYGLAGCEESGPPYPYICPFTLLDLTVTVSALGIECIIVVKCVEDEPYPMSTQALYGSGASVEEEKCVAGIVPNNYECNCSNRIGNGQAIIREGDWT